MMSYVMTTLRVLLAELAGVGVVTGVLYIYWNALAGKKDV